MAQIICLYGSLKTYINEWKEVGEGLSSCGGR